ncbi:hypothetical protein KKE74_00955 [Patescibacteria group bacterium]|nr:hypothetical protein [Patescibacteria group bacterium]MBU2472583.1 hypothetical protein [Patescibacteria group bacterium]
MKYYQKIIISSLLLIGLFSVNLALAGGLVPCGGQGEKECNLCHIWQLADNILDFVTLQLVFPIAALLFVAAGVVFLISGGSEEKVTLARTIFTNTVIGLMIVLCSWLLIDTLVSTIAGSGTEAGGVITAWETFPGCD